MDIKEKIKLAIEIKGVNIQAQEDGYYDTMNCS